VPRAPRPQIPGGLYHVTTRGNRSCAIVRDDYDRRHFVGTFAKTVQRFGWLCHAVCLMTTHYHAYVETPEPNLAAGMQFLNGRFARDFNARYRLQGHLFERRYCSVVVETEEQGLELVRYIYSNPVRAGICGSALDWPWSTLGATIGRDPRPRFLTVRWVLDQFADDPHEAALRLVEFVAAGGRS
jgi:REP element-mobilizing transposase RayT